MHRVLLLTLLLASGLAAAHSLSDELSVNTQQPSAESPRSGGYGDRLSGSFDLSDAWTLNADLVLTHENPVANPDAGTAGRYFDRLQQSATTIFQASLGADWMPNDHWDLSLTLNASPSATQTTFTQTRTMDGGTAIIPFRAQDTSLGGLLAASYTTAGFSNWETTVDASLGSTSFGIDQRATGYVPPGGRAELTPLALRTYCDAHPSPSCTFLKRLLRDTPAHLQQLVLGAGVTETLFQATDVGLSGTYTLYNQDPSTVGFYSVVVAGRPINTGYGSGVPIAPITYTLRPSVTQRLGAFSATLYYEFDQYTPGQGYGNVLGGKLQVRFSRAFKLWLSFSGTQGTVPLVPGSGTSPASTATEHVHSGTLALGARWRF